MADRPVSKKPPLGTLLNISKDGKPPKSRMPTAESAHAAFEKCEQDAALDKARVISLRGIYDGHPPLSQSDLDECGLGDMPNINTKQFSGKIDAYCTAWLDLNTSGDSFTDVRASEEHVPPALIPQVSGLLTRFFDDAILDWAAPGTMNAGGYIRESAVRDTQMGLFGIGPAVFMDPFDWRFVAMPLHRVLVPRGTFLSMSNCQMMFIKWKLPLTTMFQYVRSGKAGWDEEAVLRAIHEHKATKESSTYNANFLKWVNQFRNNDPDFTKFGAPEVKVAHTFIREFAESGESKISHHVICQGGLNEHGYLYSKLNAHDNWGNVITPFCDRVGPEGVWHGIKGFGDDIFDACHFQNTLFNWTATNAILNGLPMFTSADADSRNKLSRVKLTRMGILYPGITPQQLRLNLDIAGTMSLFSASTQIMDQNTRIYGGQQTPQTSSHTGRPSPTEIMNSVMSQTQFSSTQIKNYRTTGLDPLFAEMYRRLTADGYPEDMPGGKQAKAFRDKCEKAGIPKEVYQNVRFVRANRNGGTGNSAADFQRAQEVYNVATPGMGQLNARKDMIAALKGREVVASYVEDTPQPAPEDKTIDLENQLFLAGQMPKAMPMEDHVRHLGMIHPQAQGHIGSLLRAQQQAAQIQDNLDQYMAKIGSDPLIVMRALDAHIAHASQHLKFLQSSPLTAEASKPYAKVINDVHGFAVQFAGNVQKALMKRRPNGGIDPKVAREMAITQAKIQSLDASTAADIKRKNLAHAVKLRNLQQAHEARQAMKVKDATLNLGLKAESTMAGIEMDKHRSKKKSVLSE
jgi:hypothetical protein